MKKLITTFLLSTLFISLGAVNCYAKTIEFKSETERTSINAKAIILLKWRGMFLDIYTPSYCLTIKPTVSLITNEISDLGEDVHATVIYYAIQSIMDDRAPEHITKEKREEYLRTIFNKQEQPATRKYIASFLISSNPTSIDCSEMQIIPIGNQVKPSHSVVEK